MEFPFELRSQLHASVTVGVRAEYHDREASQEPADANEARITATDTDRGKLEWSKFVIVEVC